jgi:hypothetical protein
MRGRTRKLLLAAALSGLAGVTSWAALQSRGAQTEVSSRQDWKRVRQEEPTPIEEGVMTSKQEKHSRLYKGFEDATRGRKIPDLVTERGDLKLSARPGVIDELPLIRPRPPLSQSLSILSCRTDAVMIGKVTEKSSHLLESGTFTFTDHELTVEEVLKDNLLAHLQPGATITVTRTGGSVRLKGHTVRAFDERMAPLAVGERYLLYLVFLPETDSYRPFVNAIFDDSFHLDGDRLVQVSIQQLPLGPGKTADASSFLAEARNAVYQPCPQVRR